MATILFYIFCISFISYLLRWFRHSPCFSVTLAKSFVLQDVCTYNLNVNTEYFGMKSIHFLLLFCEFSKLQSRKAEDSRKMFLFHSIERKYGALFLCYATVLCSCLKYMFCWILGQSSHTTEELRSILMVKWYMMYVLYIYEFTSTKIQIRNCSKT